MFFGHFWESSFPAIPDAEKKNPAINLPWQILVLRHSWFSGKWMPEKIVVTFQIQPFFTSPWLSEGE